jgi:hypothetical protein
MSTAGSRFVTAGVLFLFIFLSGFWLSRSGKPYNGAASTIHKLIGVGAGLFLAITVYRMNQTATLSALALMATVVTGLFFLSLVVSGGLLMAGERQMPAVVLRVHQIAPYLTVLSTAVSLAVLLGRK